MRNYISLVVTLFQQNARILYREGSSSAVVIDPGGEAERILAEAEKLGVQVEQIWLTHSHIDHCGGVKRIKDATGAKLIGHEVEKSMREGLLGIADMYGIPRTDFDNCPEPDEFLEGGEVLEFAGTKYEVLFTPGHAPGHLCFYSSDDGVLIAGDTLFYESIGRTDLPGGDHQTLLNSIREKLFTLPEDTKVLPGHGPDTTIGHEKRNNPFLQGTGFNF